MDTQQAHLIRRKLTNLTAYVKELAPYLSASYQEHRERPGNRRIVERLAQVIVECAIDINGMLLISTEQPPAQSARQSFEAIHQLGIIDEHLLPRFRRYVGMRNRIVHDYDRLDNRTLFYSARRLLDDARAYIVQVHGYLEAIGKAGRKAPPS
ncbi:MAG: DUF86 domain-containing protein [Anaerolineae bacterium]